MEKRIRHCSLIYTFTILAMMGRRPMGINICTAHFLGAASQRAYNICSIYVH